MVLTYAGDTACGRRLGPASTPAEDRFVGVVTCPEGVAGGTLSWLDIVVSNCEAERLGVLIDRFLLMFLSMTMSGVVTLYASVHSAQPSVERFASVSACMVRPWLCLGG